MLTTSKIVVVSLSHYKRDGNWIDEGSLFGVCGLGLREQGLERERANVYWIRPEGGPAERNKKHFGIVNIYRTSIKCDIIIIVLSASWIYS